ncbi:uncharacterized protein LOC127246412 [Andrographis paniculata]|uniref:uncharacterized protein LOC127246412 n=1 Tax=Andrographis paniculata TaxID=175694 RepID=UPI0021E88B20|nr:uncharacterized protein LOC127246412 [Andrographis paniculata]XP_051123722.1 uncharacterized protein LOC127246412 [Andrographis paniculata]XP_051123723.1 uncharacterized protein LOC127246412 [Andrographis paniculata]XP_051123724.1 uncharacterized protein LOC127246412 [Andrographis paniculata]XP_051123725.1 uncharacterized protein LOC127246412 [Andrographis paniculata]XP_051123726.1 uncharacterized protein LOC127246412 [Andrographis paniculata]XP_051123727.1 uncharacterized protein LOC12724
MVALSPVRQNSPSRLVASSRFGMTKGRSSGSATLEKMDPLSRSAKRNFQPASSNSNGNGDGANADARILSLSKSPAVESTHRRSPSSCSVPEVRVLSPPRNLVESAHRRSISSSTCRTDHKVVKKDHDNLVDNRSLNAFLKEQRIKILQLMSGEIDSKAKVVLSGPSNSTSSMVAATCYACLLDYKMRADKKRAQNGRFMEFVVPVMIIRRGKMWKQRQAAWLFHDAGLDAASLLFSNEVELETLMMAKQLSIVEVGEDILKTNYKVGSACTVLTDNFCEDAYSLLPTPVVEKLLVENH